MKRNHLKQILFNILLALVVLYGCVCQNTPVRAAEESLDMTLNECKEDLLAKGYRWFDSANQISDCVKDFGVNADGKQPESILFACTSNVWADYGELTTKENGKYGDSQSGLWGESYSQAVLTGIYMEDRYLKTKDFDGLVYLFELRNDGVFGGPGSDYGAAKRYKVVKKAKEIAKQYNYGSTYDKVKNVYMYLATNVAYDYSYTKYTPYDALYEGVGVCTAFALSFQLIMDELGVECYHISDDSVTAQHMWNVVRMEDGKFYYVDACYASVENWNRMGWLLVGTDTRPGTKLFNIAKSGYQAKQEQPETQAPSKPAETSAPQVTEPSKTETTTAESTMETMTMEEITTEEPATEEQTASTEETTPEEATFLETMEVATQEVTTQEVTTAEGPTLAGSDLSSTKGPSPFLFIGIGGGVVVLGGGAFFLIKKFAKK